MLTVDVTRSGGGLAARIVSNDEMRRRELWPVSWENRNDWKTFEAASAVAGALGRGYIATDAGAHVHPRYDVIRLPAVGDAVSYGFNGDYYPCGKIVKVSEGPTFRRIVARETVTLAGGEVDAISRVFYRRKLTGSWVSEGTWSLVSGLVDRRNMEF